MRVSIIALLVLMVGSEAFGQAAGGAGGANAVKVVTGRHEFGLASGYIGLAASATEFDLAPAYRVAPLQKKFPWLQIGGEITWQKLTYRTGSTSSQLILLGPTANLGGATTNECFFVSLGVAIRTGSTDLEDSTTTGPNGVGFYFFTGKRFPISGAFTLTPSLGVVATGTTGMVFRPFAVSMFF